MGGIKRIVRGVDIWFTVGMMAQRSVRIMTCRIFFGNFLSSPSTIVV